jgi:hypothetical protein
MKLDAGAGMSANLEAAKAENARVVLQVKGGVGTYEGYVGEVKGAFVVLEKLVRREFFDALIRIDAIVALEVQTRTA